jgi:hypothetical protein
MERTRPAIFGSLHPATISQRPGLNRVGWKVCKALGQTLVRRKPGHLGAAGHLISVPLAMLDPTENCTTMSFLRVRFSIRG